MAKAKWFKIEVSGAGAFPTDMLRYDSAWPLDDRAVNVLTDVPENYERRSEFFDTVRTVRLGSVREPTAARWASFGWRVTKCEPVR